MVQISNLLSTFVSLQLATSLPTLINQNDNEDVISRIPSEIEAASIARTLVFRESLTNINTLNKDEVPVSSMEYYVDCDNDGDFYWLVVDIGSANQNILRGSDYSFTIRVGDHPINDNVNPNYPGGISSSPAGSPRINLEGKLHNLTTTDPLKLVQLERCFLARHPDAKWWLPNNVVSAHNSHWTKFEVEKIYMVGGFGDRAYIGPIDTGIYHSVTSLDDH